MISRREDSLDVEIFASGFTKEMDQHLNEALLTQNDEEEGGTEKSESEDDGEQGSDDSQVERTDKNHFEEIISDLKCEELETLQSEMSNTLAAIKLDGDDRNDDMGSVSGFSIATSQATIAPEVIKSKVKKSFEKTDRMNIRKRIRAKGEASAVTRSRRANMDNIKQSTAVGGFWGD